MSTITAFIRAVRVLWTDETFRAIVGLAAGLLIAGTVFYTLVEGWSLLDALYFSVVTLTTVGFGDFAPHTDLGKGFTIVFILAGIGIIVAFASQVVNAMVADRTERARTHHAAATDAGDESAASGTS